MILCIGTTPAAQRVMIFRKFELDCVNRAVETLDGVAGKSVNVAKVLAALGAQPVATGFAGGQSGRELLRVLLSRGIQSDFVSVGLPTRQCITVLDQGTRAVTELVEESRPVPSTDYDSLQAIIQNLMPRCDAVVMSGSLTPGGPLGFYGAMTAEAKTLGILSVVDAQGPPLMEALSAGPGLVKPNREELSRTVQQPLRSESDVIAAMREVLGRGAARVVVTAGKSPAFAMDNESLWRIHSPAVPVVNPIGSGDAFTAGLAWRLTLKENLGEACRWAAAAGAANTLSAMPGELKRDDVERLVNEVKVEKL
jgi:tagatose 6-phosphate kinase